jgi:hypothetical protein
MVFFMRPISPPADVHLIRAGVAALLEKLSLRPNPSDGPPLFYRLLLFMRASSLFVYGGQFSLPVAFLLWLPEPRHSLLSGVTHCHFHRASLASVTVLVLGELV